LGKLKEFFYASIVSALWYLLFRVVIGGVKFDIGNAVNSTLLRELINIPPILFYYLKTFFFPLNFAIWQEWYYPNVTFQHFVLPLFAYLLLLTISVWFYFYLGRKTNKPALLKHKRQKQYVFFSFWFI